MNIPNCILFFVRFPRPGRVKTRLGETVGSDCTSRLYSFFTTDMLETFSHINCEVIICFDPCEDEKKISNWLGKKYTFIPQQGNDIGQRMKNALLWAFSQGFDKAVVIGSDIPDLPADYINTAFYALSNSRAVIGPASDGGYYLIGFNADSMKPQVFDGISFSTGKEYDETINAFDNIGGYPVAILQTWHDVDTIEDLQQLVTRNKNTDFNKTKTYEYAKQLVIRNY